MNKEKRLIDADALIAYFEEQYNVAMDDPDPVSGYVMSALRCCLGYFKTIPTVDAVEVVRCKNCAYYDPYYMECSEDHHRYAEIGVQNILPDDYCSRGERRTDETD